MNSDQSNGNKCQKVKRDGQQCQANPMADSHFCFFHDPSKANDREAARRAGGIQRSRPAAVLPLDTPDRPLRSRRELADLLRDMINKILRGQLDPKIGYIVGYLAALHTKALEQAETEENLLLEHGTSEERELLEERKREKHLAILYKSRPPTPAPTGDVEFTDLRRETDEPDKPPPGAKPEILDLD